MLIVLLTFISNLQSIDSEILFWIHRNLHSSIGNAIIPYLRIPIFWLPLYILILGIFIKKWKLKFWIPLLIIGFTVGLCDYTSVHLFKKQIERPRPCYMYENDPRLDLLIPCGGKYGFISTHAANHMAIAVFFILFTWKKSTSFEMVMDIMGALYRFCSGICRCSLSSRCSMWLSLWRPYRLYFYQIIYKILSIIFYK